mgnify:CR=1 FL=1
MREHLMFQVDAFSDRVFAGNPAAVMVLDTALPDLLMQAIAAENNLAETAFVLPEGASWSIRWFTPTQEAAFCGHATLAAAHVLASEYGRGEDFRFRTGTVGELRASRNGPARYTLDLPLLEPAPLDEIPVALPAIFPKGWKAVFRNFENLFVELGGPDDVAGFRPDMAMIARLAPFGLGITAAGGATHDGDPVDFVSRYFAPAAGIPEDPVTGSAHTTLAPYWARRLGRTDMSAFQASPRGGLVACRIAGDRVFLSGWAATFFKAGIRLPG